MKSKKQDRGTDVVGLADHVIAGLSNEVVPAKAPCPTCGKDTKDDNSKVLLKAGHKIRVCSSPSCRTKANWSSGKPKVVSDEDVAQLEADAAPDLTLEWQPTPPPFGPEHPCPECGKEMKDDNTHESKAAGLDVRICSSKACRARADWATGKAVRFVD